jgi:hypothetical protein
VSGLQPWEKSPQQLLSLFFLATSKRQNINQNQNLQHPVTPSPWKASLHHVALKNNSFISHANWLQSCLCETVEETDEHQAPYAAPLPHPTLGKIIQHSPWAD